jgi:small neutral amino acid transporter SnatA (MarC family)
VGKLFAVIGPIALIDSMSMIPLSILAMSVLAPTVQPLLGYFMFVLGILVAYYVFGMLVLLGLGVVFQQINARVTQFWNNPNTPDMAFQIVLGAVLLFFGVRMANKRREKEAEKLPEEGFTPGRAFALGIGLTIVGMPGALPFFAAADQMLRADLSFAGNAFALGFYVVAFVVPMFVLLFIRIALGKSADAIFDAIDRFLGTWGRRIIMVLLIGLGAALLLDGIGWFLGWPLLPVD